MQQKSTSELRCFIKSGVGGIRTHASLATPNGFRVRPLQPDLGTTPWLYLFLGKKKEVEEAVGFEPTHGFRRLTVFKTVLLNHLSTPPSYKTCMSLSKNKNGGGGGIRTHARLSPPDGFQDRSLKPLEYASVLLITMLWLGCFPDINYDSICLLTCKDLF